MSLSYMQKNPRESPGKPLELKDKFDHVTRYKSIHKMNCGGREGETRGVGAVRDATRRSRASAGDSTRRSRASAGDSTQRSRASAGAKERHRVKRVRAKTSEACTGSAAGSEASVPGPQCNCGGSRRTRPQGDPGEQDSPPLCCFCSFPSRRLFFETKVILKTKQPLFYMREKSKMKLRFPR